MRQMRVVKGGTDYVSRRIYRPLHNSRKIIMEFHASRKKTVKTNLAIIQLPSKLQAYNYQQRQPFYFANDK